MEWLVLLLVLGNPAPQTTIVEPTATAGSVLPAGGSTQPRGWTTSDRSEAKSAIMRLQIARHAR